MGEIVIVASLDFDGCLSPEKSKGKDLIKENNDFIQHLINRVKAIK